MMQAILPYSTSSVNYGAIIDFTNTSTNIYKYFPTNARSSTNQVSNIFLLEERKKGKNLNKLSMISNLNDNWNGNGAKSFSLDLVAKCSYIINEIIRQPDIFPTGRNSIQMEYEKANGEYLELEVFEDEIYFLYVDKNEEETEGILEFDINKINECVLKFYE